MVKTLDELFLGKGHFFLGSEDTGWEPNVFICANDSCNEPVHIHMRYRPHVYLDAGSPGPVRPVCTW